MKKKKTIGTIYSLIGKENNLCLSVMSNLQIYDLRFTIYDLRFLITYRESLFIELKPNVIGEPRRGLISIQFYVS